MKEAVSSTPVLRYYNIEEEVTLQCDASQYGLGAALLQAGQPVAYASRALTPAETRYAQIEKELLAIVFACEKFEEYIYARNNVHVETDHKPLESIVVKPLNSAPKRLQRMLLRLQQYDLVVQYKKGRDMFLADTLSRAYLPEINTCDFARELEGTDHQEDLPLTEARWQQIKHSSADDPVLQQLRATIKQGWPQTRSETPEPLRAYFDFRELTAQNELVFKGERLVVPAALRKELMAMIHDSHIGIEGCIRRARESLYWPHMATELRNYISKCDICLSYRSAQTKEPLLQHDMALRPWSKVGADPCEFDNRTLLVICDYYSNYIEVARVTSVTSRSVIKEMKIVFARYGIPDTLVTDNGPQFASDEFAKFAKVRSFEHVTSSPRYPQSNGKAENAVKTVKRLFTKSKASGGSECLALLDWRNTPTEGVGTSPAQRLMGRRCKTLLPVTDALLQPRYSTEQDARSIMGAKQRQQHYYNKCAKPLEAIKPGETVRLQLPGQKAWSPGVCVREVGPRSFVVKAGSSTYRRNRRHLIRSGEQPLPVVSTDDTEPMPENKPSPPEPVAGSLPKAPISATPSPSGPRRSQRSKMKPAWLSDYVAT